MANEELTTTLRLRDGGAAEYGECGDKDGKDEEEEEGDGEGDAETGTGEICVGRGRVWELVLLFGFCLLIRVLLEATVVAVDAMGNE
jgi:hypothetical protein